MSFTKRAEVKGMMRLCREGGCSEMRSRIKVQAQDKTTSQQKTREKSAESNRAWLQEGMSANSPGLCTNSSLCLKSILFQPAHS